MLKYLIPESYKLNIHELLIDTNFKYIINNNNIYTFNFFSLYINKKKIIYKFISFVPLESLLDIFYTHTNIIIKKLYYFLIIKYLLKKEIYIQKQSFNLFKKCLNDCYYDLILHTREYHISNNNEIIITDYINSNICLIIINKSLYKSFIAIIDQNCLINNLHELIMNSKIISNSKYENINIMIIGGCIDNINIIIYIYTILKILKISKFIDKTYLFKSINRLKFNSDKLTIKKLRYNSIEIINNNLNYINNINYYSYLHKV